MLKKTLLLLTVTALSLLSAAASDRIKLDLQDAHWTTEISGSWQTAIPASAKKIPAQLGKYIDLKRLKKAPEHIVYLRLNASADGEICFGMGADWYLEAFLNGEPLLSTMKTGNITVHYAPGNFPVWMKVRKGTNLLAVRVKSGSAGAGLVCGKSAIVPYKGPTVLCKRIKPFVTPERSGDSYRLIVLGDTHFDAPYEVYHTKFHESNPKLRRIYQAEFARNEVLWRSRGPRLLKAAASHINADTRAVIQLGDLVQGDCGDPEIHKKMLLDTLKAFQKEFKNVPFLTVSGNHDVRGPGAKKAYDEVIPQYHSRLLGQNFAKTTFYFMFGQDLYVFVDFNAPDYEIVFEAFRKHAGARYKFVVSHGAVIPTKSFSPRWFLAGDSDNIRWNLRQLFMENDVMVLTGHVHALEVLDCVSDQGRITQLMANSVWNNEKQTAPAVQYTTPAGYYKGVWESVRGLFAEYKDTVKSCWRADGAGYFVLDITPECIKASGYHGDSVTPFKVWELKK